MRFAIGFLIVLLATAAYSDEIRCYSGGRMIYHSQGYSFSAEDYLFSFVEAKTNAVVFSNGDCIVKITRFPKK